MGNMINTIAGIGMTMLAGFGGYNYAKPHISDYLETDSIKNDIDQYPEHIDGASVIDKYFVEGSKYVLVHVKQIHSVPSMIDYDGVVDCQNDIINIFKDIEGKENVLVEGNSTYKTMLDLAEHEFERYKKFNEQGVEFASDKELEVREERLNRYMRELESGKIEKYGSMNATNVLEYQDEIEFYKAENHDINVKRCAEAKYEGIGKWNEKAEDLVVEYASQIGEEKPFVYTVFGSSHSFKNNIDNWNETHPESKMSLIEITPNAVN